MSVKVSSPKQSRIPEVLFDNPVVRKYIEYQRQVLFELWTRTGGGFDRVAANKIISINSDTELDNTAYGAIIVVDGTSNTVQVTLPPVDATRFGESVIISVINVTFNTTVIPSTGTVLGAGSKVISTAYDTFNFSPIAVGDWIAK